MIQGLKRLSRHHSHAIQALEQQKNGHVKKWSSVVKMHFLREALFTSVRTVKTGMLVRVCVWKVITFCEEDMRGDHVPVGKGILNDRFF